MDFISFLQEHVAISIWIIGAVALLSGIVAFYKNFSDICAMVLKIKSGIGKLFNLHKKIRRRKYNAIVSSEDYLKWQNEILNDIYNPIIKKFNENNRSLNNVTCEKAVIFSNTDNAYYYEAVYFQVDENKYSYPFTSICNKDELIKCRISEKKFKHTKYIDYKPSDRNQRSFYNLMKPTIRFPDNIGYALDKMTFENGFHFTAKACTYKMNVCTSNIMEYELYKLYLKERKHKCADKDKLGELKTRNKIHKYYKENIENIFTNGAGRISLLGVQAMVLCKNYFTGKLET